MSVSTEMGAAGGEGAALTEAQKRAIADAANTPRYLEAPVPAEVRAEFSDDFGDFAHITGVSRGLLASLYGSPTDAVELLREDWAEAFRAGALRLHAENTVSFPTRVMRANGMLLEVSVARSRPGDAKPWYTNYVPRIDHLRLARDEEGDVAACPEAPCADGAVAPADPPHAAGGQSACVPPLNEAAFDLMRAGEDYLTGAVPEALWGDLPAEGRFADAVWVSQRWQDEISGHAGGGIDVCALLARDWDHARSTATTRYYEGKVIFPVSVLRSDGTTPLEISLIRNTRSTHPGSKPWVIVHVNDYVRPRRALAGKALYDWAYLGDIETTLSKLADAALDERWSFGAQGGPSEYPILKSYLTYTFYRLQSEGKVLENREKGLAAFNTGLVDRTYEPIYACFTPGEGEKWRFEAFCRAGSRQWGKLLVSTFNPLPARASYFCRKEDLLYDASKPLERDVDHILIDNMERLPRAFLEEEMRSSAEAVELIGQAFETSDDEVRRTSYGELRELVEDDVRIKRRLINRLDDAIELARKRVEWNFKTAVPAFYPTKNKMSLLLPLDLTDDGHPDVALVVELLDSGAYLGQTILTMWMAYNNARLISRPDSDWLNTSLEVIVPEE